ncbi:MAG: CDGSH iron-sulfur domain-containing protein [Planctomycetota bacterium]|nr:CDGSH iron-sulfur domain-containing protein [Planctomycetota bacterium]
MARLVKLTATGSHKIDPTTWPRDDQGNPKKVSICACGLSSTFPICDGSHKVVRDEEPGFIYVYDQMTKAVISKTPEQP